MANVYLFVFENWQPQQDTSSWPGAYYGGYGQGYEAYGYSQAPQDPNMYAAYGSGAYPGYAGYGQQQQQPQQVRNSPYYASMEENQEAWQYIWLIYVIQKC
jgi:hypothetical protein